MHNKFNRQGNENFGYKRETYGLPTMEMPWITSDGQDGLYFVGMIGMNPEGEPYYLVKVGRSSNIKKRIELFKQDAIIITVKATCSNK